MIFLLIEKYVLAAFKEILAKAAGSILDLGQAGIFFEPLFAV
jgi:hypothetical protein